MQLPVVERRAQYLVDVARSHGQTDGDDQALRALLTAEQLAHEEVRYQPAAYGRRRCSSRMCVPVLPAES